MSLRSAESRYQSLAEFAGKIPVPRNLLYASALVVTGWLANEADLSPSEVVARVENLNDKAVASMSSSIEWMGRDSEGEQNIQTFGPIYVDSTIGLNLRTEMGTDSEIIRILENCEVLGIVNNPNLIRDGFSWVEVQDKDGNIGYVVIYYTSKTLPNDCEQQK